MPFKDISHGDNKSENVFKVKRYFFLLNGQLLNRFLTLHGSEKDVLFFVQSTEKISWESFFRLLNVRISLFADFEGEYFSEASLCLSVFDLKILCT